MSEHLPTDSINEDTPTAPKRGPDGRWLPGTPGNPKGVQGDRPYLKALKDAVPPKRFSEIVKQKIEDERDTRMIIAFWNKVDPDSKEVVGDPNDNPIMKAIARAIENRLGE